MSPSPTQPLSKRTTTSSASPNASTTSNDTYTINAFAHTDGSLSIGAKAGIALAALIVTALILVGILYLMKRAKRARKASVGESMSVGSSGESKTTKVEEIALSAKKDVQGRDLTEGR